MTVRREQSVKRDKTNKIQQSDVYVQLLSQHVSGIIMPIFRRTKALLLHLVCCSVTGGENVDISRDVCFVGQCVVT